MIERLYSDFDPDITIRSKLAKTFSENEIDFQSIRNTEGVSNVSRAVEEVVVLKHEKKWVNAHLIGVDTNFLSIAHMADHTVYGESKLTKGILPLGICGVGLLDNLNAYSVQNNGYDQLVLYSPKRNISMRFGSNPFHTNILNITAGVNFNKEVNTDKLIVPITFAREALDYDDDITALYVDVKPTCLNEDIKVKLNSKLGTNFEVKTNYEKNELIYQTSKSEKLIVFIILIFIFILASFNLIASLTMLFIEKQNNVRTMISFGANQKTVQSIFVLEGLLIAGKGIVFGLMLGYGVSLLQLKIGFVTLPESGGEAFPMKLKWEDALLICLSVSFLSFIFSYLPVRHLVRRNFGSLRF